MLYSFFTTQWNSPSKGDWTELVKRDLEDLNIPCSFEVIKSKSKEAFNNLVKKKTKEFAFKLLQEKKHSHTKMENINYEDLKIQTYFTRQDIRTEQKKILFKFRTRMARFGQNYRGGKEKIVYPLCDSHIDNQDLSYICPVIRKEVKIRGSSSDIYCQEINKNTVETLEKIVEVRKSLLEEKE